jgi:CRP/FNR family transcriptional regulator
MKVLTESEACALVENGATCFRHLQNDETELIRKSKTLVQFRKGENLTKQGAFASYILFITDGFAKQHIEGDNYKSFNLRIFKAGEFVGLSSVFNDNIFGYSCIALCETRAYLIEKTAIRQVLKQSGEFAFSITQKYCTQNTDLLQKIGQVMFKQMPGKLAETLLYLSSDEFSEAGIFKILSRKDIADFAGMSSESVVKLLKIFEKDQIIRLDDKDIVITNRTLLEEISKRG